MPQNYKVANEQWERYTYCRDNGHLDYLNKSRVCEDYFAGYPDRQWDPAVAAELRRQRRPNLTINKILSTMSSIIGEQIDLRMEVAFKATSGAPSDNADILTKVFKYISNRNQLNWARTEMFADGGITSRGFLDVRMNFDRSTTGDITIECLNPRNVIPDPDASEYDPDKWNDVIITQWMTADDIEHLYSPKDAELLRARSESVWEYGYDSIDQLRDRFGGSVGLGGLPSYSNEHGGDDHVTRMIRVINRQHRKLGKEKYVIDLKTGDRKCIPESMERDRIAAMLEASNAQQPGRFVIDEYPAKKIRWTVTADDVVLHDKWSPYKHFTTVPFFPIFRKGTTIGFVENLISVQDLLNKVTSQELHVINTTANSGWKVKRGSLMNMTADELEMHGARTGVVLELDDVQNAEKIQPNQVPQGLDLLSRKAENYIKAISARGDAQMGMTRADVSADQIEANNAYGDVGLKPALDNLARTDHILARNVLDLVQEYYTDPRIMRITNNDLTGEQTEIKINWPDPQTGEVLNDVSLGEYEIQVVQQKSAQTLEDIQFQQAVALRKELGVAIPDEFLLENSNLINKTAIIAKMKENAQSEAAQLQEQMKIMGQKLELSDLKAETSKTEADATLKRSKAASELAKMQKEMEGAPGEAEKAQQEMALEQQKHDQEMEMMREKHALEMQIEKEKAQAKIEEQKAMAKEKQQLMRAEAIIKQKQAEKVGQASPKDVVQSMGGGGGEKKEGGESGVDKKAA